MAKIANFLEYSAETGQALYQLDKQIVDAYWLMANNWRRLDADGNQWTDHILGTCSNCGSSEPHGAEDGSCFHCGAL
jgi:hypothetical protein